MIAMTKSSTPAERVQQLASDLKNRRTFSLRTRLRLLWKRIVR